MDYKNKHASLGACFSLITMLILCVLPLQLNAKLVDLHTGTATFSIPIEIPPATSDVAPKLSINYNHNNGGGWLGMGWGLTGLGSITRTGPNYSLTPTYGYDDTFILHLGGSSRLVKSNRDSNNQIIGEHYRTKIEKFMHIEFVNGSWEARDKNGTTFFFGQTDSSRQNNPNTNQVFTWYLDKVMDTHGVYWTISYDKQSK